MKLKGIYQIFLGLAMLVGIGACQQHTDQKTATENSIKADSAQKDSLLKETNGVADTAKAVNADYLIVPGKSIGQTRLGSDADSLIQKLGKPDKTDAAMGAQMMTWYARHDSSGYITTVYSHRKMGGADERISHIKQIRVTSPVFKTADHIGVGTGLNRLKQCYQISVKPVPRTKDKSLKLYDDITAGIAFELDASGQCRAVIVHASRDSLATYLNMR